MPEITTPRDLFLHELGDILYVERALAEETLPKLIDEVEDKDFRGGLEAHLEQSRQHVANVEEVFELLGEEPQVEKCIGFEGLKKDTTSSSRRPLRPSSTSWTWAQRPAPRTTRSPRTKASGGWRRRWARTGLSLCSTRT